MAKMTVTVHFTGLVNIKKIASGDAVPLPEGTDVAQLLSNLGIIEQHKKYIIVTINGEKQNLSTPLKNNDVVKFNLLLGGG